jgi:hypothetical protein
LAKKIFEAFFGKLRFALGDRQKFCFKKDGEIGFQKQAAFCLSHEKAVRKYVDEIDTWQDPPYYNCKLCFDKI